MERCPRNWFICFLSVASPIHIMRQPRTILKQRFSTFSSHRTHKLIIKILQHDKNYIVLVVVILLFDNLRKKRPMSLIK